jgi:hypothetical protein
MRSLQGQHEPVSAPFQAKRPVVRTADESSKRDGWSTQLAVAVWTWNRGFSAASDGGLHARNGRPTATSSQGTMGGIFGIMVILLGRFARRERCNRDVFPVSFLIV